MDFKVLSDRLEMAADIKTSYSSALRLRNFTELDLQCTPWSHC